MVLGSRSPAVHDHYHALPPARELTTLYEHRTKDPGHPHSQHIIGQSMPHDPLSHRNILILKPIDYIGLYIIVIASSCITVNWLFRTYF